MAYNYDDEGPFYLMEKLSPKKFKCLYVHLTRDGAWKIRERMWTQDSFRRIEIWNSEQYTLWDHLTLAFGEGNYG